MVACTCGYTTDPEKNCNGTHKVVQAVKADIAEALEANGFPHASEYVKTKRSLQRINVAGPSLNPHHALNNLLSTRILS